MNLTPEQNAVRERLLNFPREVRHQAARDLAVAASQPWAQELLCLGLADSAEDIAQLCASVLSSLTRPSPALVRQILDKLDATDQPHGLLVEGIVWNWTIRQPGLIRVLAARGLKRRTLRVLIDVVARTNPQNNPDAVAAFRDIAAFLPDAVKELIDQDYESGVYALELLAWLLPIIRSNQSMADRYIAVLSTGPIFWLKDDALLKLLTELQTQAQNHKPSHLLLQKSANQALKQQNGGFLKIAVPILACNGTYAAKSAMVLAKIASASEGVSADFDQAVQLAVATIRRYAPLIVGIIRKLLLLELPEESMHVLLLTLERTGPHARPASIEIAALLRKTTSDMVRMSAIQALTQIGFDADSEAIAVLTLLSMSGSEAVQEAAVEALKKWYKEPEIEQPAIVKAANSASAIPAPAIKPASKAPPGALSLAELAFSFLQKGFQGCYSGG